MCGQITIPDKPKLLRHYEAFDNHTPHLPTNRSYGPGNRIYVVGPDTTVGRDKPTVLGTAQWGFQPETRTYYNARFETLTSRPLWRDSALHRRCIVPAATFAEGDHQVVTPHMLAFAAIWRKRPTGSFVVSVVTVAADEQLEHVHSRMPLILTPKGVREWLNPSNDTRSAVHDIGERYRSHPSYRVLDGFAAA